MGEDKPGSLLRSALHLRSASVVVRTGMAIATIGIAMGILVYLSVISDGRTDGDLAAPHTTGPLSAPSTTPNPTSPPGLPVIDQLPPKIDVPPGSPLPIATKYGYTYDIPVDWLNMQNVVAGWENKRGEIARYSSIGQYGKGYCPQEPHEPLAMAGITGRNGVDPETAARDHVRLAKRVFASESGMYEPHVDYVGPTPTVVAGRHAVRFTATVTDIPADEACRPPAARFDVIAVPAYATAEVMLLMVELHQGIPNAPQPVVTDQIIASMRPSEIFGSR